MLLTMDKKGIIRKTYHASETKAIDGEQRTLIVRITTKIPDRSKDVVLPEGMQLENYLKNPIVAAFHRYDKPAIGRSLEIQQTDDGVVAKVEFTPPGINPEADMLFELYKGGFMNAWSIGFRPIEFEERPEGGREFKKWELLEYSSVLVPDNPEALTVMRQKGLDPDKIMDEQKKVLEKQDEKGAIPFKETPKAPEDAEWDAGKEVKEAEIEDLKIMCAWYDEENSDVKSSYKLPHHKAKGEHPVVWRGVAAAMGSLLGARGGVNIPDSDEKAVYNHLAKHYKQFDKEPPEFRSYTQLAMCIDHLNFLIGAFKNNQVKEEVTIKMSEALAILMEVLKLEAVIGQKQFVIKEGRVLSEKNRKLISETVIQMREAIKALDELLKATEPAKEEERHLSDSTVKVLLEMRNSLRKNDKDVGLMLRKINEYVKSSSKKGGENNGK